MTYFYKIIKTLLTALSSKTLENTFPSKSFSNTLFSHCINDWNKLNENLINVNSIYKFKHYLTKFIKVKENSTFSTSDPLGLKLLIRLRLNFSHLNKPRFRHNFRDTINYICSCSAGIETTDHDLLRCQGFAPVRSSFLNKMFEINVEFRNMNELTFFTAIWF